MTAVQATIIGSRTNPADDYRYQMDVTPEGAVPISGTVNLGLGSIVIGSVSAHVDSVYVQSGDNIFVTAAPSGTFYASVEASGTIGFPISGVVSVAGDWIPFDFGYAFLGYTGSNMTSTSYFDTSGGSLLGSLAIGYDAGNNIISIERTIA